MKRENVSTRIDFESLDNTRDLGGISNQDGKMIRKNLLIRSGALYTASPSDLVTLKNLGILKIFDFRNENERSEMPDPVIEGAENIHICIRPEMTAGITREKKADETALDNIFIKSIVDPEFNDRFMCENYRGMLQSDYSVKAYAGFLKEVLEADGPVLWHCSAGKDRAGIAAVLLLEILNVSREDIYADYLHTNQYIEGLKNQVIGIVKQKLEEVQDQMVKDQIVIEDIETAVREVFGAKKVYLDAYYKAVEETYGSMEEFILRGLGVDSEKRLEFQKKYLL